ncbi:MAG TPA: nuclear transport factor 2 family protein [Gemmatimonadota bacterium]|nr:nuclear transport factor 2 family protein [Gemmatimonadota bacterium]
MHSGIRGRWILAATIAATIAVGGRVVAQEVPGEAERAFEEAYAAFSAAYRAGDPAGVAALYADDAFYLAPGDEIDRGDVGRHFEFLSSFEPGAGPVIEFEIVDREVSGDLAYDIGYFTFRREGQPAEDAPRGKFIVIWKRGEDGVWRIHADGYSDVDDPDAPAEADR